MCSERLRGNQSYTSHIHPDLNCHFPHLGIDTGMAVWLLLQMFFAFAMLHVRSVLLINTSESTMDRLGTELLRYACPFPIVLQCHCPATCAVRFASIEFSSWVDGYDLCHACPVVLVAVCIPSLAADAPSA